MSIESVVISDLSTIYRAYIDAILSHDLDSMIDYVAPDVVHNGKQLNIDGYQQLLRDNIVDTNMHIDIKRLVCDRDHVAAVLVFTTSPKTMNLVGIELGGQVFSYFENVVYDFRDGKIAEVHSVVDLDTIRAHAQKH